MKDLSAFMKKMSIFMLLIIFFFTGTVVCSDNFDDIIRKETCEDKESLEEWMKFENISTPRAGSALGVCGDDVYIYGGKSYFSSSGDLWRFNPVSETKEILTAHDVRAYHAMCLYADFFVCFGGKDESGNPTRTLFYYVIASDVWSNIPIPAGTAGPAPDERFGHIMLSYNGLIFIHGGSDLSGNVDGNIYSFDPTASPNPRWELLSEGPKLEGHGAAIYNGKLYIFGGYNSDSGTYSNNLWIYDISGDSWQNAGPVSGIAARCGIDLVQVNGNFYTMGGQNSGGPFNGMIRITPQGGGTVINSEVPQRAYASMVFFSNRLGIFGGFDSQNNIYFSDMWICYPDQF